MKCAFSLLKQDDQTYHHVCEYYRLIQGGHSPYRTDLLIQRQAIAGFLKENNLDEEDCESITLWIKNNSSTFRSYLNSVKIVALFLQGIESKSAPGLPDYACFCRIINLWNKRKSKILDSLFV